MKEGVVREGMEGGVVRVKEQGMRLEGRRVCGRYRGLQGRHVYYKLWAQLK